MFKASRGIEDIYELTYIRKDGSRFPAVVSVTALRDAQDAIIGYLLIGTDNTARASRSKRSGRSSISGCATSTSTRARSSIQHRRPDDHRSARHHHRRQQADGGADRVHARRADRRAVQNYFTDSGRAEAGINRVLNEGKVTNYELTARARDGTLTVVSYNATHLPRP